MGDLPKEHRRANLFSLNLNIWLRTVCDNTCGGTTFVFVAYALALGVKKEYMGFLSSALGLACVAQVMGVILGQRMQDKKRFVLIVATLEPLVLITAVLVSPFLPTAWRIYVLGLAMFCAAGLLHLSKPFTEEWSASTVPAGLRGRYLGNRLRILTIVLIATTLALGLVAERVDPDNALGFGVILAVGGLFGWLAVVPLRRISLPPISASAEVRPRDLLAVWRHRPFRRYMLGIIIYTLPFSLAMPYYQVYHLEELNLRKSTIALISVSYLVSKVFISRRVGQWLDRFGPRVILLMVSPIYAGFFFSYVMAGNSRPWLLFVAWCICGIADGCFYVGGIAAMYQSIPDDRTRSAYFAVMNLSTLGMYAAGAALAVPIVTSLQAVNFMLGPFHVGQYQALYLVCTCMMVLGAWGTAFLPSRPHR